MCVYLAANASMIVAQAMYRQAVPLASHLLDRDEGRFGSFCLTLARKVVSSGTSCETPEQLSQALAVTTTEYACPQSHLGGLPASAHAKEGTDMHLQ
jgi:hypothetical protein